ncbi:MAG: hypothetical protein ACE5G5_02845, partial [Candidatus Methylomirabilales bacterium]
MAKAKKRAKAKKKTKARKRTRPRKKARATKTKKAFGGYSISFKGRKETLESVFGSAPIGPSVMTKKLWTFVKRKRLGKR